MSSAYPSQFLNRLRATDVNWQSATSRLSSDETVVIA